MTDGTGIVTLNHGWLNGTETAAQTTTEITTGSVTFGGAYQSSNSLFHQWYPWVERVYVTEKTPARPIKLSLSEVDALRKAAKADDKLRAILAKFTDQIEVVVDFGKSAA